MFLHDPPKPRTRKELKVYLPVRQHRTLRDHQRTTGQETPSIVAAALDLYFSKLRVQTP